MPTHILPLLAGLVACSSSMLEAVRLARLYAKRNDPVVISGPTGSGKSHLARVLHAWSARPGPLLEISVPELHASLAQNQLFGHEREAYTGAANRQAGLLAEAGAGTVFLDEGDLLKRRYQALLLRLLDSSEYRPLGAARVLSLGARIVIGTQESPDALVRAGQWRPDFRYRVGFFEIGLAALRERRGDIAPLAELFLKHVAAEENAPALSLSADALAALELADWEGNARELRAELRLASCHARGEGAGAIGVEHLRAHLRRRPTFDRRMTEEEKDHLLAWALWKTGGNALAAADLIGMHRNSVSARRGRLLARQRADGMHGWARPTVQTGLVSESADD